MSYNLQKLKTFSESVRFFVQARHKDTGGFAATRNLPVTIEDTYHAINILCLLDECTTQLDDSVYNIKKDKALLDYLQSQLHQLSDETKTSFQLLKTALTVGLDIDKIATIKYVSLHLNHPFSMQRWYYLARIAREVLDVEPMEIPGFLKGMGYLGGRTVNEAWMSLYLARSKGGHDLKDGELISWFRACQNGDGGFGFLPDTTSYIENCYVCLRALASLGAEPKNIKGALDFVIGCHTGAGGFARSGRAAPFLDATWYAVASISIIAIRFGYRTDYCSR